jgi:hypothetical protein
MAVNARNPVTASLSGSGYLSAHLNMSHRPKEGVNNKSVRIDGIETHETETVRLKWPTFELQTGDVVELQVLPDGQGDPPSEIRSSSESPYKLFLSTELARELVQAVAEFERRLSELLRKSGEMEPTEEHKKFTAANASIAWELGQHLLYPVYRGHRELIPEELKGELL